MNAEDRNQGLARTDKFLIALIVAGFCVGTFTHTRDLIRLGFFGYSMVPVPVNLYWTILTFADPAAALLLVLRTRTGLIFGMAIMASDIVVNSCVLIEERIGGGSPDLLYFAFQLPFAILVAAYSFRYFAKQ